MSIFVRIAQSGSRIPIDINVNTTLNDIGKEISHIIKNPIFNCSDDNTQTLADLGICPETTIEVRERIPPSAFIDKLNTFRILIDPERNVMYHIMYHWDKINILKDEISVVGHLAYEDDEHIKFKHINGSYGWQLISPTINEQYYMLNNLVLPESDFYNNNHKDLFDEIKRNYPEMNPSLIKRNDYYADYQLIRNEQANLHLFNL